MSRISGKVLVRDDEGDFYGAPGGKVLAASPLWARVLGVYGPFAFGVISFMALWIYVVKPELVEARAARFRNDEISLVLRDTMLALERTVSKLEGMASKMELMVHSMEKKKE